MQLKCKKEVHICNLQIKPKAYTKPKAFFFNIRITEFHLNKCSPDWLVFLFNQYHSKYIYVLHLWVWEYQ